MDEVLDYRLGLLESNQRELSEETKSLAIKIAKMEGKEEANQLTDRIKELRSEVNDLSKQVFEIVGAMKHSKDRELSKVASGINIAIGDANTDNFDKVDGDVIMRDQTKGN